MKLAICRDCEDKLSYFADACPHCGAHYTRAIGTYHRGLTYSGVIALAVGLYLTMRLTSRDELPYEVKDFVRILRATMFLTGGMLLVWGIFQGAVRRALLQQD